MKGGLTKILMLLCITLLYSHCKKPEKEPETTSCAKPDQLCDSARVAVGNMTQDTIYYRWSFNPDQDTLLPGQIDRIYMCQVDVKYNKDCEKQNNATCIATLESSHGVWAIKVDHCNKTTNFRYDVEHPGNGLIFLYNDTQQ